MKVDKPWGHEIRWAVNDKYIGKIIRIEPGHRLSRQYHQQKYESIYVLDGVLVLELGTDPDIKKIIMKPGASWDILPHQIHRFAAPSDGCTLVEVSTSELEDVVRGEDDYGRGPQ